MQLGWAVLPVLARTVAEETDQWVGEFLQACGVPGETLANLDAIDVVRLREAFGQLSAAGHLMSGSGSCYFGLCRNLGEARRLAGRLVARRLGSVFVTSVACGVSAA